MFFELLKRADLWRISLRVFKLQLNIQTFPFVTKIFRVKRLFGLFVWVLSCFEVSQQNDRIDLCTLVETESRENDLLTPMSFRCSLHWYLINKNTLLPIF